MFELRNAKTVNMKLTRADVCDLLIALTCCQNESGAKKWDDLHDKVRGILEELDKAYDEKYKELV